MATRVCAICGEEKNVSGGKICENDHFICKKDLADGWLTKSRCPLDKTDLR